MPEFEPIAGIVAETPHALFHAVFDLLAKYKEPVPRVMYFLTPHEPLWLVRQENGGVTYLTDLPDLPALATGEAAPHSGLYLGNFLFLTNKPPVVIRGDKVITFSKKSTTDGVTKMNKCHWFDVPDAELIDMVDGLVEDDTHIKGSLSGDYLAYRKFSISDYFNATSFNQSPVPPVLHPVTYKLPFAEHTKTKTKADITDKLMAGDNDKKLSEYMEAVAKAKAVWETKLKAAEAAKAAEKYMFMSETVLPVTTIHDAQALDDLAKTMVAEKANAIVAANAAKPKPKPQAQAKKPLMSSLTPDMARKKAIAGLGAGEIGNLDAAAKEIEALTAKIGGDATREMWSAIGSALWRARELCPTSLAFGAWVVANGIHKKPGLATASSRSDCIWLVERHECADLINFDITHPRRVRAEWRKLLKMTALEANAKLEAGAWEDHNVDKYQGAIGFVVDATCATEHEAWAALSWAMQTSATPGDKAYEEAYVDAHQRLKAALTACDAAGVGISVVLTETQKVYGEEEMDATIAFVAEQIGMVKKDAHWKPEDGPFVPAPTMLPWNPAEEANPNVVNPWGAVDLQTSVEGRLMAAFQNLQEIDGLTFSAAYEATFSCWPVTAADAKAAMRAAMKLAHDKAFTIDDAKEVLLEVFW